MVKKRAHRLVFNGALARGECQLYSLGLIFWYVSNCGDVYQSSRLTQAAGHIKADVYPRGCPY